MSDQDDLVMDKYKELLKGFSGKLKEKIVDIHNAELDLVENGYTYERIELLHRLVHSLTGTSAMFGLSEVSDASFKAEILLKPYAKENKEFDVNDIPEIQARLKNLKDVVEKV